MTQHSCLVDFDENDDSDEDENDDNEEEDGKIGFVNWFVLQMDLGHRIYLYNFISYAHHSNEN